jgi:hypothetical protein
VTEVHARRDWWRFWGSIHDSASRVHDKALSATLRVGRREYTLGYRRKGWVE